MAYKDLAERTQIKNELEAAKQSGDANRIAAATKRFVDANARPVSPVLPVDNG